MRAHKPIPYIGRRVIKLKTPLFVRSAKIGDIGAFLHMILQHETLLYNTVRYYAIVIDKGGLYVLRCRNKRRWYLFVNQVINVHTAHFIYWLLSECICYQVIVYTTLPSDSTSHC